MSFNCLQCSLLILPNRPANSTCLAPELSFLDTLQWLLLSMSFKRPSISLPFNVFQLPFNAIQSHCLLLPMPFNCPSMASQSLSHTLLTPWPTVSQSVCHCKWLLPARVHVPSALNCVHFIAMANKRSKSSFFQFAHSTPFLVTPIILTPNLQLSRT